MTRVLEFVVALIIVFVLAVIVGLFLPSHAHIERSIEISHNPVHIYDVLNNFRRFSDTTGAGLVAEDPSVKLTTSGPAYGTGATLKWAGDDTIGNGTLVNKSSSIDITDNANITWDLKNDWHGTNKVFTFTIEPNQARRVTKVTWAYDVDYGWNLIARYSGLWIHGQPATMIQYGLDSLQNMLAGVANVDYSKVDPGLYATPATPVLLVSTKAPRTVDDIDTAKTTAMQQIRAAMAQLGVKQAGPTTTIRTEWGDTTFRFDVAVPINTSTLTVGGKSFDLAQLPANDAAAASSAGQPAPAASTGAAAAATGPAVGSVDKHDQLVINANVRAAMMPAGEVLAAKWTGESGVQFMVKALEAYAATHGYKFDESNAPAYNQLASLPSVDDDSQLYRVFLPVTDAPAQTPDQIAGRTQTFTALDPSLWAGAAPAKPEVAKKGAANEKKADTKHEARKRPAPAHRRARHR
ncbi:MAG TPA: polyketide cyclase [Rhodanobacteraceae bacterium]